MINNLASFVCVLISVFLQTEQKRRVSNLFENCKEGNGRFAGWGKQLMVHLKGQAKPAQPYTNLDDFALLVA